VWGTQSPIISPAETDLTIRVGCYLCPMTRILLLAGVFALGTLALPAHAADSNRASAALCKKHKKKKGGKKKAATPVKAPSSNI